MKKKIEYWLLILLATNSLNLLGQDDSLIFKKPGGYLKNIPLNDFIFEINKNQIFVDKLSSALIVKGELSETINGFSSKAGDEKISLDFYVSNKNIRSKVPGISIPTLLKAFELNPTFYSNFKNRAITKTTKPKLAAKRDSLSSDTLLFEYLTKHPTLKTAIAKRINASNFILNYWWEIVLLGAILGAIFTILAWYIGIFRFKRNFFMSLNAAFFSDKSKEMNNQHDIISYLQVKSSKDIDNVEIEKLKSENKELLKKIEGLEKQWNDFSTGKTQEEIKEFLSSNGFYADQKPEEGTPMPTNEQSEIFYFASVNRDGDLGIFKDENKSFSKEADSLYKFEVKKSNPNEAKFWFDANSSMVASVLSYRSYKIEPVCTSNIFEEGQTRIIHIDKGTAILDRAGRWIVEEGNKAKIRYE